MSFNKIMKNIDKKKAEPLESEYEIEEIISFIKKIEEKIEWLKGYKKYQNNKIANNIERLESKENRLREVVSLTLDKVGKKSLSFPGVGKVVSSNKKGKWNIVDQDALVDILKKELDQDQLDKIVSSEVKISKKNLNKVLDKWDEIGKLPESVERSEEGKCLSVTFDKDAPKSDDVDLIDKMSMDDFDSISVGEM
ncbi:MAG: hypothetical protein ACOC5T_06985 [Elusimicrobiota bacterium]